MRNPNFYGIHRGKVLKRMNTELLREDERTIKLTQGKFAIIDGPDYDWLNQWRWCAVMKEEK